MARYLPEFIFGEGVYTRETDITKRCTSRFASMRCSLRSGHDGTHVHDGVAGTHGWGSKIRKRQRGSY